MKQSIIDYLTSKKFRELLEFFQWVFGLAAIICLIVFSCIDLDSNTKKVYELFQYISGISGIACITAFCTSFLSFYFEKIIQKRKNQLWADETIQRNANNKREQEEKELLRKNIDLVLEMVEEKDSKKYRLVLHRGDGSKCYLTYKRPVYDTPVLVKDVTNFYFRESNYNLPVTELELFHELALPTLKNVIQHYQKYGNLEKAPPKVTTLETFIISRAPVEDPPDLTGLDTIHDLAPLLLTAEQENNHKALNKILDRMDSIRETQLRICR